MEYLRSFHLALSTVAALPNRPMNKCISIQIIYELSSISIQIIHSETWEMGTGCVHKHSGNTISLTLSQDLI